MRGRGLNMPHKAQAINESRGSYRAVNMHQAHDPILQPLSTSPPPPPQKARYPLLRHLLRSMHKLTTVPLDCLVRMPREWKACPPTANPP